MGVTNTWKWEDANRVIQDSKHYSVLPAIKHKKQAFNEYINEFTEKLNHHKRENRKKQIDEFYQMLDQVQEINILSKFIDCIKYLQSDRRFLQLDEKDREECFQDYMDELEKREIKRKQEPSKRKIDSLKALFQTHQISTSTKFEEAKELFKTNAIFNSADKLDQLKAFSEFISDKIVQEEIEEEKAKYREERKNRENFKQLMEDLVSQRKLLHNTHWKDIAELIKDDERYHKLLTQDGSRPMDIFRDIQDREKDNFNIIKVKFKSLLKTKNIKIAVDISKEEFHKILSEYEEYTSMLIESNNPEEAKLSENMPIPQDYEPNQNLENCLALDLLYDYYCYKVRHKKDAKSKRSKPSESQTSNKKKKKRSRSRSKEKNNDSESDEESSRDYKRHSHKKKSKKSKRRKRSRSRSNKHEVEEGEYVSKKE